MRLALTVNGPGETAGWLRPLLRALYERRPELDVTVFVVPDDYATGREAEAVATMFPQARVVSPSQYVKFALGRNVRDLPDRVDLVLYLGGDLMHAARIAARLHAGTVATYKFARRREAPSLARAYAVDERNAQELRRLGVPAQRVVPVGNLAIAGALLESQIAPEPGVPNDGILFMPGSRGYEVENLVPFFFTAARRLRRELPHVPIAFGISPFTPLDEVRAAIQAGGIPEVWSERGDVVEDDDGAALISTDGRDRFSIVRGALCAARASRMVVTIPGTKVIEVAAVGRPVVACTILNAPERITINGPLTYLARVPLVGAPLKRSVVVRLARAHRFHTQPNIDAERSLVYELHGTLTPGRVARVAAERYADRAWCDETGRELAKLYAGDANAAQRMADDVLRIAG